MRPSWFESVIIALALTMGCGGGSSVQVPLPTPVPDPPTALSLSFDKNYSTYLQLNWTPPSTNFSGYEIQTRVGDGAFENVFNETVPSSWKAARFLTNAPELSTVTARMRTVRLDQVSSYSTEATARRPLLAPDISWSPIWSSDGIYFSWFKNSLVADTLKLERGLVQGTTSWTTLDETTSDTREYTDHNAPESMTSVYRITYSKGQDSAQITTDPVTPLMVAPNQISATPLVEGVHLSWHNSSLVATETAILRATELGDSANFQQIGLVPASTTSYDDTHLATGYYTYRLENRNPIITAVHSTPVQVSTLPPQTGISLLPSVLSLPGAEVIRRSSTGAWFLSGKDLSIAMVRTPIGDSWNDYLSSNTKDWREPYFLLDSHDRPHLVYTRSVDANTWEVALIHDWKEETGWKSEEIARRTLRNSISPGPYTFILDPQDRLQLVWLNSNGSTQDLEYAIKGTDGRWMIQALTGLPTSPWFDSYRLTVDATGQPHLAIEASQNLFHYTRASGDWTIEPIPSTTTGSQGGTDRILGIVASTPDVFTVLATRLHDRDYSSSLVDLVLFRKTKDGWLPEEVIPTAIDRFSNATLAFNKPGTRFALYYTNVDSTLLGVWINDHWTSTLLSSTANGYASYGPRQLGFDASGSLYLILQGGLGSRGSSLVPYVLYQEQP